MISYEYYKVFYYCCKFMSFTKAAMALNTSQSSVSHTIGTLEYQLGCRLFVRSNKGISLTAEGEHLYIYVKEGCEQFIKGENEIMNGFSADKGTVYLSATETALHCFLFGAINKFCEQFSNIKFSIENGSSYDAINDVKSGKSDYAVVTTPADIPHGYTEKSVLQFHDVLICGEKYKELSFKPFSIEELKNYPYVSLSEGTATRTFYEDFFQKHAIIIRPDIEVETTDMALPMVRNNLGLGFVPEPMAKANSDGIYVINTDFEMPYRSVSFVYNKNIAKSPAAKTFYGFCTDSKNHL